MKGEEARGGHEEDEEDDSAGFLSLKGLPARTAMRAVTTMLWSPTMRRWRLVRGPPPMEEEEEPMLRMEWEENEGGERWRRRAEVRPRVDLDDDRAMVRAI